MIFHTSPGIYQNKLDNILEHDLNNIYIFTDDSKQNDKAAYVAILNKTNVRKSLPKESSIFTWPSLQRSKTSPMSVLDMTLNKLMVRLKN